MNPDLTANQKLKQAYQLMQEGNYVEAVEQFFKVAAITDDFVERAGILLNLAATLTELARFEEARTQIKAGQTLLLAARRAPPDESDDLGIKDLEIHFEFQEAYICRAEGKYEEALSKLDALLCKYDKVLRLPSMRSIYELIQCRRAFQLCDIGHWSKALPILEEAKIFKEEVILDLLQAEISFYLGSCHFANNEFAKAEAELSKSLRIGLPPNLEFRAHLTLGMADHKLEDYAHAKLELEKAAQTADAAYIKEARLWVWLESTCRHLGLTSEAEHYAQLARPS
jgi:tetratricopeptide (TPR) repeat protein